MNIFCPKCQSPITTVYTEHHDYVAYAREQLFYCTCCRSFFLTSAQADIFSGDAVELEDELIIPQPPVKGRISDQSEFFSARVFHISGVLFALIALFWHFVTVCGVFGILPCSGISLTASVVIGTSLLIVGFVLTMLSISLLANRISLEYFPATGDIVYRKGPFNWWSRKLCFNASEIAEIHSAVAENVEGDYFYTAIHFNNGRKERFLDFSQKSKTQIQFMCLLQIMSVRGISKKTEE